MFIRDKLDFLLNYEDDTLALGYILGKLLRPGDIVLIKGELGTGKTVFSRGLARGVGVDKTYHIVSPSFTLLNIYPGRIEFYHADLYRIEGKAVADLELLEESAKGVLAVEWPERGGNIWPREAFLINLFYEKKKESFRRAQVSGIKNLLELLAKHWLERKY